MAVGTSNIAVSDVLSEMDKSVVEASLNQCVNAAIETSTGLGGQASESSLNEFSGYTHGDALNSGHCVFKFDPHLPMESGVIYDPYDDTVANLPFENNDSNVYTEGINQATFSQGTGTDSSEAGYLRIVQANANYAGMKYTGVTTGKSYKPNGTNFTVAFWIDLERIPTGTAVLMASDGTDNSSIPYYGWAILVNSSGAIITRVGNGGGTASSNRRTSVSNPVSNSTWYLVEVDFQNMTTIPSSTIRFTPATATNRNTNSQVASTSGSGSAVSYSNNKLYIGNALNNVVNNIQCKIGHVWIFDGVVETTAAFWEPLFDSTKTQYTL